MAALLVIFMQAGFALLEIGFSRQKNAGTVVAKILTNFAIAGLMYWAIGFALAFGNGDFAGHTGWFLSNYGNPLKAFGVMGLSDATVESKWLFQFSFCAVSLAIVWGTTLERIKFGVYVLYAIVFAGVIYPIASHWVFGGGWLQANLGMQDFAGSTAVHMIGATGALAVLLQLGARRGRYGADGKPRAIPGHNMPLFGLGVLILWLGWFGFNPGSTLNALDGRFPQVALVTMLAAAAGVLGAIATARWKTGVIDIGMAGNGAIGALVAITAPSGYVDAWAAPIIGVIAGVIVPLGVYAIDRKLDDPVGALSAHGLCGVWGTLSCGLFTAPHLAKFNGVGEAGLFYGGSLHQLGAQALGIVTVFAFVFVLSYAAFWAIKKVYGLRVSAAHEDAGLDISEHGMYGYPEQFIPAPELVGYSAAPGVARQPRMPAAHPTAREVPA
jgi:Amt family ammonium transporter